MTTPSSADKTSAEVRAIWVRTTKPGILPAWGPLSLQTVSADRKAKFSPAKGIILWLPKHAGYQLWFPSIEDRPLTDSRHSPGPISQLFSSCDERHWHDGNLRDDRIRGSGCKEQN